MKILVFPCLLALGLFASMAVADGQKQVSKEMFGDDWPLTVDSGVLKCVSGSAVIFISAGKSYGINGFAKSLGYQDIEPIWKEDKSFLEMVKVVAKSEGITQDEALEIMGGLPKINIGPLIDAGLELCR